LVVKGINHCDKVSKSACVDLATGEWTSFAPAHSMLRTGDDTGHKVKPIDDDILKEVLKIAGDHMIKTWTAKFKKAVT
jgi:hypothetical protein